ncbi:LOW QUALITY PROTEIN: somatostatin receptor type 5-like [Amphiura filiformis]|uniref:LOW QUALITY PROTEIN: somatostatin receptor type 5-like n=1 Tax=Amphiura filiformis TaxID=82378 RepID=UPI003B219180
MLTTTAYAGDPHLLLNCSVVETEECFPQDNFQANVAKYFPPAIGVVSGLGLLFNGFIIAVLLRFSNMKTLANTFILNLALADFLFMFSFIFLGHQMAFSEWIFGPYLCRIIVPYDAMTQFTIIFFLSIMSIDRYFAICLPFQSMSFRTLKSARIVSVLVWVIAILTVLPVWMFSREVEAPFFDNATNTTIFARVCMAGVSPNPEADTRWWIIYTMLIGFCIPLSIICICYLLIMYNLLNTPVQIAKNTTRKAARRVAILVISVVIVFILCFLPFYVVQLILGNYGEAKTPKYMLIIYSVSWFLMYSHSIINPIVYTLVGENFRQNLLRICRPRRKYGNATRQSSMRTSVSAAARTRNSVRSNYGTPETGTKLPINGQHGQQQKAYNGYVYLAPTAKTVAKEDPV